MSYDRNFSLQNGEIIYTDTIYFDRNIFIYATNGKYPKLVDVINLCKKNGKIFPYSPAHMEEIVKAITEGHSECENDIELIKDLSGEMAFCPVEDYDTRLICYPVIECRYNVEKDSGREQTELARDMDADEKEIHKWMRDNIEFKKVFDECKHCQWDNIFDQECIQKYLKFENIEQPKDGYQFTFQRRESLITKLYKLLDLFGFRVEDSDVHIENRMHDISHIIYASSAEIFVSNDKKLRDKAKAIFKFLSIPTSVMNCEEFITTFK